MIHNIYCLKPSKDKLLNGLAAWLNMKGIGANSVTLSGLVVGVTGALCLLLRQNNVALLLLGLSIGADMLDGTVARLEKRETLSGKLLDSICDRIVETAWIGALIITGAISVWAIMLAVGSIALFLCRYRAHLLGISSTGVTVTRFERIVALIFGAFFQQQVFSWVIYAVISVGTFISCFQIIWMIIRTGFNTKNASHPTGSIFKVKFNRLF